VKPDKPVVSYLTALTGLTQESVERYGRPLAEQIELLKTWLPKEAALVGQNILMVRAAGGGGGGGGGVGVVDDDDGGGCGRGGFGVWGGG